MKSLKFTLNQDILKIIALISMTIDHIAKTMFDGVMLDVGVCIGRISFPIFAFLLMKHLAEKSIYKKYIIRLLVFGVITFGIMFCFCGFVRTARVFPLNIFITFLIVVLYLKINDLIYKETGPKFLKYMMYILNFAVFAFLSLICDYGVSGFLFLVFLYCYFKKANWLVLGLVLLFSGLINMGVNYWVVSLLTMLVLLFVEFDKNAKRIIKKWWMFYAYYPLHFFIIMLIKYLL